jgi:hypothetical protein
MLVPWTTTRCLICLGEPDAADRQTSMTEAHVIPRSVGGKLAARFLCAKCNSSLGTKVEAGVLSDPGIRLTVEALSQDLPDALLADMRKRQRWFTESDLGQVEATMDAKGELRPLESRSLMRHENASAMLESEWRVAGLPEEEITLHLEALEASPGQTVDLPGFTVRPNFDLSTFEFGLPLDEALVSELFPIGIAYLYLALLFGDKVYDVPHFKPIRAALIQLDAPASPHWNIESRIDRRGPAPWHGLAVKETGPPLVVHIHLFQERVWWVHFPLLAIQTKPPRYGIELGSGVEFTA